MDKNKVLKPITDREIISLYNQGLSIEMLTDKVKNADHGKEKWGSIKSRNYVHEVIYEEHMRIKRENEKRRAAGLPAEY